MIQTKTKYIRYLSEVKSLTSNLSTIDIDIDKIQKLKSNIENSELIVPVIGAFSAGKSTLINSFLENKLLPTAITPETSLATELRYSSENFIEAIKQNGSVDKFTLNQMNEINENTEKYSFLRIYLDNNKLKEIQPLVLVDMPGFDSPVKLHNQAILNYLNKGVYFILLTSIEDGSITKSMMREIENIMTFGKGFSFCLSKTNLKPPSAVNKISHELKKQLKEEFDYTEDIILLDDDGGENLKKILNSIDCEALFEKMFQETLKLLYFEIEDKINVTTSVFENTKDEALEAIKEVKKSLENIERKKEEAINTLKEKYGDNSVENIIQTIANQLRSHKNTLVKQAIQNPESFNREISEIIRHSLLYELKKCFQQISDDMIHDFNEELKSMSNNIKGFAIDEEWSKQVTEGVIHSIQQSTTMLNRLKEWSENKEYKTLTTILSLVTSVLNPLTELVIIFAPEIIAHFKAKKIEAEISAKFESEIIPELSIKLRNTIPDILNSQIRSLIESISQEYETKLMEKEREIASAIEQKEQNIQESEQKIEELRNLKQELQKLTTQLIYKG